MMWTSEEKQVVAAMLADGHSAGQIAAKFPGRSRQAVIGVVRRNDDLKAIGLKGGSASRARIAAASIPFQPAPIITGAPQTAGRPLMAMGAGQCRFPVNDAARGEQHLFCASPADGSWCEAHVRICYAPKPARDKHEAT